MLLKLPSTLDIDTLFVISIRGFTDLHAHRVFRIARRCVSSENYDSLNENSWLASNRLQ